MACNRNLALHSSLLSFYTLEHSPQYSSYTEIMDFIQILCFTPKAHRNLFFYQEPFESFCLLDSQCMLYGRIICQEHMRSHVQYMVHLYSSIKTLLVIFGFHPLYNFYPKEHVSCLEDYSNLHFVSLSVS